MSSHTTSLFFRNLDGVAESLELPTIQNLCIPDNSSIPSRPTITGEYRNQFVCRCARKVSFVAWLEDAEFNGDYMKVEDVVNTLDYLQNNRIKFNLTTTEARSEAKFLTDLVIENITYNRDATTRQRHVATINCTQIKLVDLGWKAASGVDIFGENIVESTETPAQKSTLLPSEVVQDFQLDTNWYDPATRAVSDAWSSIKESVGLSGTKQDVGLIVRDQIESQIPLNKDDIYFKLGDMIQLSLGTRTYNCKGSFQSTYGAAEGEAYNVDLIEATVVVTKKEASLVPNFSVSTISRTLGLKLLAQGNASNSNETQLYNASKATTTANAAKPSTRYPYDFADTYSGFQVSQTMTQVENLDGLADYLDKEYKNNGFSSDPSAIANHVIVKDQYVYTYQIKQRYEYSVTINGKTKKLTPTGGLDVTVLDTITTSSEYNYRPTISDTAAQKTWDEKYSTGGKTNYKVQVAAITLGTMLQLYVFSPGMLNTTMINYNK